MIRAALLLSASLLALPTIVRAQPTTAPAQGSKTQLDRIESKLDDVLRRVDQLHPQPPSSSPVMATRANGAVPSPAPTSNTAATTAPASYKPGALAIVHAAPRDINSLSEVPPDSMGGFVYQGGPIVFTDIHTRRVRYAGPAAVEIQGWFRAKEAGRYELGTDITAHFNMGAMTPPSCLLQVWLEDRSLDQRSALVSHPGSQHAEASLILGAELQPGLYRLRVWTACTIPPGVNVTSELLLKAPSEMNMRPVTGSDVVHREDSRSMSQ